MTLVKLSNNIKSIKICSDKKNPLSRYVTKDQRNNSDAGLPFLPGNQDNNVNLIS